MEDIRYDKRFEYENGYYLTASPARISKFVTHLDFYREIAGLPGEIVECGVFKGLSLSRFVKLRALFGGPASRRIIGFDTFGAFPEATHEGDALIRGRFLEEAGATSITREQLRAFLAADGLDQNVELVEGDLTQTGPAFLESQPHLRIALLNVDLDLMEPTRTALELFYPRVVGGGIVILDDYGKFPGASEAIEGYLAGRGVRIEKLPFTNGVSFVRKP